MKSDRDAHEEPGRLLDGSDPQAPQELLRALRALRQEQPSPAMLDRLVERVANAPLTGESSTAGTLVKGAAVGKWLAGSGLLVVVGTVASLAWPSAPAPRTPEPVVPTTAVSASPSSEPRSDEVLAPSSPAQPRAESAQATPSLRAESSRAAEARRATKAAGPRSVRRARREQSIRVESALPRVASAPHDVASRAAEPAAAQSTGEEADAPATREQAPKPAAREAPTLREESGRVALPTEAELLVRARSLRNSDAEAALALLDQHARRFGAGLLAVEREVLTIETLRKLGRQDEAARRLAAFRSRYPSSPHTRRLSER